MKYLYLFILTIALFSFADGQPYTVSTPTIIGNNNWNTKIITKYYCSSNAFKIGHSYSINYDSNEINLISCYTGGGLFPTTTTIIDTINIGLLPAGNYNLNYTVFISLSYSTCAPYDTVMSNYSFYAGPNNLKEENIDLAISIYPNPVKDLVNIISSELIPLRKIVLFNLIGEKVLELDNFKSTDLIDLSSLPKGVYLLNIYTDKKSLTKKLIKD